MITASGRTGGQPGERLDAVLGGAHLVAVVLQGPLEGIADGLIIIDDQDMHAPSVPDVRQIELPSCAPELVVRAQTRRPRTRRANGKICTAVAMGGEPRQPTRPQADKPLASCSASRSCWDGAGPPSWQPSQAQSVAAAH